MKGDLSGVAESEDGIPIRSNIGDFSFFLFLRKIGLEMTGDNAVKWIVFGIARTIFGGCFANTEVFIFCNGSVVCKRIHGE